MPDLRVNKFDNAAADYDDVFTNSQIGIAQRNRVYHFLKDELHAEERLNILELNCGTGEDALYIVKYGHRVIATDISERMLEIARSKDITKAIDFIQMGFHEIELCGQKAPYDLIFSNFGGINCINEEELRKLLKNLDTILAPGGNVVAVIMPSFCLWETFYFLIKMKFGKALRRRKMTVACVSGALVETWYYSPNKLRKLLPSNFKVTKLRPIGFFLPPSYLGSFFSENVLLLNLLVKLERSMAKFGWQSAFSDHFLIKLEKQ